MGTAKVQTRAGALRRPILVAVVCSAMLLVGVGQGPARADVTAVSGSAYGFFGSLSLLGTPPTTRGPTPAVTLPAGGSAVPVTATVPAGRADYGPATVFTSGPITVSTAGTTGASGSVASSTTTQTVNTSGDEVFTAANVSSACTASEASLTRSVGITNGTLQTSDGNPDVDGDETIVPIPANPAPNTTISGMINGIGDSFRFVFNEQIVGADGSVTVRAAHQYLLGPSAVGDLIIGQAVCGLTAVGTTGPQTAIDSGPAGPTSSGSPGFAFSSSAAGSTFQCKLDGPGAATGTYGSCSSPKGYTNLADGTYTFSVRATDTTSNTDATPATQTFTVDTAAPQTTIGSGPSGTTSSASPSFGFSSSKAGSIFECRLDGPGATTGRFGFCSSPRNYTNLADGSYTFSVRATDPAGNTDATPATQTFTVSTSQPPPPPPPPPPPDTTNPQLISLSQSPASFRAASKGPSVAAPVGTTVSYKLSEPAAVSFRIERALPGKRSRGRCVKPTRSNRRAKRCTRYVTLRGTFTHQGKTGQNRFKFSGRLSARKLAPGRYRLHAVATDPAANKSATRRSSFRIVRR